MSKTKSRMFLRSRAREGCSTLNQSSGRSTWHWAENTWAEKQKNQNEGADFIVWKAHGYLILQLSINSQILRDKLLTNSEEFGKISGKSAYKKSAYNTNGLENTFEKENLYESKKKKKLTS